MAGEQIAGVQNAWQRLDGRSNRAFIAGLEMNELKKENEENLLQMYKLLQELCESIENLATGNV